MSIEPKLVDCFPPRNLFAAMTTKREFQHDFDNVEDYLHHRSPYLLVDAISQIEKTRIVTKSRVSSETFYSEGHFPGAPILPGAMMQEMATQSAGILIAARHNPMQTYNTHDPFFNEYALGVLIRVKDARFKSFARPGDQLTISVNLIDRIGDVFEFKATITIGDRTIMQNEFQLANIPSKTLQG